MWTVPWEQDEEYYEAYDDDGAQDVEYVNHVFSRATREKVG